MSETELWLRHAQSGVIYMQSDDLCVPKKAQSKPGRDDWQQFRRLFECIRRADGVPSSSSSVTHTLHPFQHDVRSHTRHLPHKLGSETGVSVWHCWVRLWIGGRKVHPHFAVLTVKLELTGKSPDKHSCPTARTLRSGVQGGLLAAVFRGSLLCLSSGPSRRVLIDVVLLLAGLDFTHLHFLHTLFTSFLFFAPSIPLS